MFLIRSAVWLALLVAMVPSDPREQARMYQTASQALHDAQTFCDRNALLCAEAQSYWAVFKDKAAIGARMAIDLANERMGSRATPAAAPPLSAPRLEPALPASDTLRSDDREAPWRPRIRS